MSSKVYIIRCDASLSGEILECMSQLVDNKERQSLCPFTTVAAAVRNISLFIHYNCVFVHSLCQVYLFFLVL
jgi:hypothetical protein